MTIRRSFTGTPWEKEVCYCRALRTGDRVFVTGTTSFEPDGTVHAPGDAYAQAKRCLETIEQALGEVGASMADIVRTRMFVTDIGRWREFGRAHNEVFAECPPTTTMVEIQSLIDPAMLIEIEADAVVSDRR